MFPELPRDLTELTDEELAELHGEFLQVARKVKDRDEDTLQDRSAEQIVAEMTAGVEAIEEIKTEIEARKEAEDNFAASLDQLGARVGMEAEEPEPEPEGDDGEEGGEEEGEGGEEEAATAASKPIRRPLPAARLAQRTPAGNFREGVVLYASGGLVVAEPGERLNRKRIGEVYNDLIKKNRLQFKEKAVVASATFDFPPERILDRDGNANMIKINSVTSQDALVASGGLCAPLPAIYDFVDVESTARPVRDALPNFQAARGGVQVSANPVMTDYADAITIVTAAEDEAGGTLATKNCMRIECPIFESVEVNTIARCIEAGNLTARAYPELMSRIDLLVRAEQARAADSTLLELIKEGSTAVTGASLSGAGAVWELFGNIGTAAAEIRSVNRMNEGTAVRVLLPDWILNLLQIDILRGQFDRFHTHARVDGYLRDLGVTVSYYKDTPTTGTSQLFSRQTAGAQVDFPDNVQWAAFPEGSWIHLDSGTLELGIVRDSVLNSTNDFQIFAETWESAAFIGVESNWYTSDICANGTVSAGKDFSALCSE